MRSLTAMLIVLIQTAPIAGLWQKVDRLSAGISVHVTVKSGQLLQGAFKSSSTDVLIVTNETGNDVTLAKADVDKVIRPKARDSLRNGTLMGTVIGFASGFFTLMAYDRALTASGYRFDAEAAGIYTSAGLLGAGIGAATGALVDYAIKGDEVLFQARR